jgi:protein DGCR14
MAELPISGQLVAANSDSALVKKLPKRLQPVPQPPPQKALEEDSYIDGLAEIVERDFFPDLEKLRKQNDFLDALNGGKFPLANELKFELAKMTEQKLNSETNPIKSSSGLDTDMSLDQFQQKYTSEDNDSFQKIVKVQNAVNMQRYEYLFRGENKVIEQPKVKLLLETSDHMSKHVGEWDYKGFVI